MVKTERSRKKSDAVQPHRNPAILTKTKIVILIKIGTVMTAGEETTDQPLRDATPSRLGIAIVITGTGTAIPREKEIGTRTERRISHPLGIPTEKRTENRYERKTRILTERKRRILTKNTIEKPCEAKIRIPTETGIGGTGAATVTLTTVDEGTTAHVAEAVLETEDGTRETEVVHGTGDATRATAVVLEIAEGTHSTVIAQEIQHVMIVDGILIGRLAPGREAVDGTHHAASVIPTELGVVMMIIVDEEIAGHILREAEAGAEVGRGQGTAEGTARQIKRKTTPRKPSQGIQVVRDGLRDETTVGLERQTEEMTLAPEGLRGETTVVPEEPSDETHLAPVWLNECLIISTLTDQAETHHGQIGTHPDLTEM